MARIHGVRSRPDCFLGPHQCPLARQRDCDALELEAVGIGDDVAVCQPARAAHEVDDDLVSHADDLVALNVVIVHFVDGAIGEDAEADPDATDVLRTVVHEEVDVARRASAAVSDHGESADQDVARACLVERSADPEEVFDLWRTSVVAIVRVSQLSASSKLSKR